MIAENWVFLRVTEIDTASHLRFPSLRLFPLAVFLRIIFPLFQPCLKCLNIFFVRIDNGSTAPYMENSTAWSELLSDCDAGKVDLIITQKVSNVSRDAQEMAICARMLAARKPPVGIYFISEDLYTLASYYRDDLREPCFFPTPDWKILPDDELDMRGALHE